MKKTNALLNTWTGVIFQSSSSKTEEFKQFARNFKSAIREQTKETFDIIGYSTGHFYVSGFLKSKENPERFVYFSIGDVRGYRDEWANHVLIRTAEHEKDFTGGRNQYTTIQEFGEKAKEVAGLCNL